MDGPRVDVDRRNTALPRLTTAQAAARLGVKPATLYAYVSRGLLRSRRDERGGSTFDPLEVEAFAASRRRGAPGADEGVPLMVLDSPITAVGESGLSFRGVDAIALSRTAAFERAVPLLWASDGPGPAAFAGASAVVAAARAAADAMGARGLDRLRLAVVAAAAADPLHGDLEPDAVHAAGARLLGTMVDSLPAAGARGRLAARLWCGLGGAPASPDGLAALDATLVLAMDHDLAVSTLAARVAASGRADPYACVQAALGAFGGALHGRASAEAAALLEDALDSDDPDRALARAVARTGGVPGFGHVVYRRRDPRADELLSRLRVLPSCAAAARTADRLAATVGERLRRPANLDLALAVLQVGAGFEPDAAVLLFAVARTAGWIAHVVDEYAAAPLRLRPRSRYSGSPPVSPRPAGPSRGW